MAETPANSAMRIENSTGLVVTVLDNGLIERICAGPVRVCLNPSSPMGRHGANLYLRSRSPWRDEVPLLGPGSNSRFDIVDDSLVATGTWQGVEYTVCLSLSADAAAWTWTVEVHNTRDGPVELDLTYVQDVGLVPDKDGQANEYYASQYVERRILEDETRGSVVCCRQNLRGPTGNPQLLIAAGSRAGSACVDGTQFYGSHYRLSEKPLGLAADALAGECAGELSVIALREQATVVPSGGSHRSDFVALYTADHPAPTSPDDLQRLPDVFKNRAEQKPTVTAGSLREPARSFFATTGLLPSRDVSEAELSAFFSAERRHCESKDGKLLSFFHGACNHVVLRAKEGIVDRPHAHIMLTNSAFVPDETIMSTTAYMFGAFNLHVVQGNCNFNRLVSAACSQFNVSTETGQRIFVEFDDRRFLLGVPSAFEIGPNHCRWLYLFEDRGFEVRTWVSKAGPVVNTHFRVLHGGPVRLVVSTQLDDENAWSIAPGDRESEFVARPGPATPIAESCPGASYRIRVNGPSTSFAVAGDEALYADGIRRGNSYFVIRTGETTAFGLAFVGEVTGQAVFPGEAGDPQGRWEQDRDAGEAVWRDLSRNLTLGNAGRDVEILREILPWYGVNAMTHYLVPHGIEQVNGAAWGTRDTSQGPLELLVSLRRFDDARQLLAILFSNQGPEGGWPQWWMFDRYHWVRAADFHADILHWCLLALSNYVRSSGDTAFLDEPLPFYVAESSGPVETAPLSEHVDRLVALVTGSYFPETSLVPFGGGDWNDAMQPADPELGERMISTWTVELNYQAFAAYAELCERTGRQERAAELSRICDSIRKDFNRHLVRDGIVSGHGLLQDDGNVELLLHPSDTRTGISYRLLPMMRGIISGIFTPEQARRHLELIERHLKGPDGARLMDRPPKYRGGLEKIFRRAESSSYFGREIGLMYMHAHLRYAESLAIMGCPDAFLKALRQAVPIDYQSVVPIGDSRQANCYYSSSDVILDTRYEAERRYEDLKAGRIPLKGGWRIYSSGPGIYIGLVVSRLLGLRQVFGDTLIDPVMPKSLDGLSASIDHDGLPVTLIFEVCEDGVGPKSIEVNGQPVEFKREDHPYRLGGALIPAEVFVGMLTEPSNIIRVQL